MSRVGRQWLVCSLAILAVLLLYRFNFSNAPEPQSPSPPPVQPTQIPPALEVSQPPELAGEFRNNTVPNRPLKEPPKPDPPQTQPPQNGAPAPESPPKEPPKEPSKEPTKEPSKEPPQEPSITNNSPPISSSEHPDTSLGLPLDHSSPSDPSQHEPPPSEPHNEAPTSFWRSLPMRFPVFPDFMPPTDSLVNLRTIQADPSRFPKDTGWIFSDEAARTRKSRRAAAKAAFQRCWTSYRNLGWRSDELGPLSGIVRDNFGGWGVTLVDNLDTLWIMGMYKQFEEAVEAVTLINFDDTISKEVNTHKINVHILGGLLGAFDLSDDERLLEKAVEVGDMLYAAFDTPNRMPIIQWDLHKAARQEEQLGEELAWPSEVGTFVLEFTRLSQLTGDPKYFDATYFITEKFQRQQGLSLVPGLWPAILNSRIENLSNGDYFALGPETGTMYEVLPKAFSLLGGRIPMYRELYELSTAVIASRLLFRPMNPHDNDILLAGATRIIPSQGGNPRTYLDTHVQHRSCFAGGMFAMGASLFDIPAHHEIANKLVDGCLWASQNSPRGVMPAGIEPIPCATQTSCPWNEAHWRQEVERRARTAAGPDPVDVNAFISANHLEGGLVSIPDKLYDLRPEIIESMFVLYRATGRQDLLDSAWTLFESLQKATEVPNGNAAVNDITNPDGEPSHIDSMGSFWMAKTLKYFYLLFSSPDTLSLDDYVFSTGGHPFRRPEKNRWGDGEEPV